MQIMAINNYVEIQVRENNKSYILDTLAIADDDPRENLVAILPVLHPRLLVHVPAVHLVIISAKCERLKLCISEQLQLRVS